MKNILKGFVFALTLLALPLTGAYAACCAGHGGVASCNKTTGVKMCKDGTASPTCTCKISKTKSKVNKETVTKTPKKTTKTTTTKSKVTKNPADTSTQPANSWWGGSSTTTKPAKSSKTSTQTNSARGCCSNHGGVAQCDKASGHQMCKDGTKSPSCVCN